MSPGFEACVAYARFAALGLGLGLGLELGLGLGSGSGLGLGLEQRACHRAA